MLRQVAKVIKLPIAQMLHTLGVMPSDSAWFYKCDVVCSFRISQHTYDSNLARAMERLHTAYNFDDHPIVNAIRSIGLYLVHVPSPAMSARMYIVMCRSVQLVCV